MTARRIAWGIWGLTAALLLAWLFLAEVASTAEADVLGYILFAHGTSRQAGSNRIQDHVEEAVSAD